MKHLTVTLVIVFLFLSLIPIAYIKSPGFILDIVIFALLPIFYYYTREQWNLKTPVFTFLMLGPLTHSLGIFGWYGSSPLPISWDHITHFFGLFPLAMLFTFWAAQFMDKKISSRKNLILLIMVFLAASGVGAVIELAEFIGYLKLGFGEGGFRFGPGDGAEGTQLIKDIGGGWINTGWDLVYNTLGVVFGIIVSLFFILKKSAD